VERSCPEAESDCIVRRCNFRTDSIEDEQVQALVRSATLNRNRREVVGGVTATANAKFRRRSAAFMTSLRTFCATTAALANDFTANLSSPSTVSLRTHSASGYNPGQNHDRNQKQAADLFVGTKHKTPSVETSTSWSLSQCGMPVKFSFACRCGKEKSTGFP